MNAPVNPPVNPPSTPRLKSYRLSADAEGGLAGTAADQPRVDQPLLEQPMVAGAFLRNAWYMAGWAADFSTGRLVHRTMLGEPLVIYRLGDGKLAALEDRCAHRFAPLSMGQLIDGCRLQCPYHGLEFDAGGQCVNNPHGSRKIPEKARVRSYAAREKHNIVWVWMGSAEADETTIPDFSLLDNPPALHTTKLDYIRIQSNYQLILDNLLDLSHTTYLHEGILGNQDTVVSDIRVEQEGNEVLVIREATNAKPPGMFAQFWPDHPPLVDKFTRMRWMPPSTMRLMTGITGIGQPCEQGSGYHAIHLLTPENAHSTHYFFTAIRFGVRTEDEAFNRSMQTKVAAMRRFAFEDQDAPVIEAQQRNLNSANRVLHPVLLECDAGPARYQRVLRQLIKAESGG